MTGPTGIKRVVVFIQENHTTDNYFGGLAPYGANVATGWPVQPNPPLADPRHDRVSYDRWLTGGGTASQTQFDTVKDLPFYAYLALTGSFFENHCSGFGTNSTPNHLLLVGGQSPTLKDPSRRQPPPLWDMPSVPGLADENGLSWRCYTGSSNYPAGFYQQLKGSPNLVPSSDFVHDAQAGELPALSYVWHNSPEDEHPLADVSIGMNKIWESVDAVVQSGGWQETVFFLTWDDWGGWDDHVATPNVEHTGDGVQLAYGPRVPLLVFGGQVKQAIDSRWSSHVDVPKTVIQLLGLPALGVPRVDSSAGLADVTDASLQQPPPLSPGSRITLPDPPLQHRSPGRSLPRPARPSRSAAFYCETDQLYRRPMTSPFKDQRKSKEAEQEQPAKRHAGDRAVHAHEHLDQAALTPHRHRHSILDEEADVRSLTAS